MARVKKSNMMLSEFQEIFGNLEENKKIFAEKLYTELCFMNATLSELKEQIQREGAVIKGTNGNGFETISEHPAQKSYNTMIKNYNATLKQLADMAPAKKSESKLKELMDDE